MNLLDKAATNILEEPLAHLLQQIYPDADIDELVARCIARFFGQTEPLSHKREPSNELWDETDSYVITYGNSLQDGVHKPLDLLLDFSVNNLEGIFSGLHILPYFPFTSDDGFAVTDYRLVNSQLGDWEDINRIASRFKLMSDLVINHCSSQSPMFREYQLGNEPYNRFFFEASPEDDLSNVVRPRTHPLLREVETSDGIRHVWCTFSHDQVDFDFSNPAVLLEFLDIMRFHLEQGVRTFRLDAIAFVWKEVGTSCIHLPQTHAIVCLLRLLADFHPEPVVLITETNVPNAENLSYFGNRNEAHMVYNFSLPPLLLHALLFGTSSQLNKWQMAMPPAQLGCAYFNFSASHDGVGLRPAEGLIPDNELQETIDTVVGFGGRLSMRTMPDGKEKPYELNTSWFDALKGTRSGVDNHQFERFVASQAIVMGLEGLPAFYVHSLLASHNDHEGVEKFGYNRAINRMKLDYPTLLEELQDSENARSRALEALKAMMKIRVMQPAFHPNATQFTLRLGDELFGIWRQSLDRSQSIFAITNVTSKDCAVPVYSINLIGGDTWQDLLSGDTIVGDSGSIDFAPYQTRWITNRLAS